MKRYQETQKSWESEKPRETKAIRSSEEPGTVEDALPGLLSLRKEGAGT